MPLISRRRFIQSSSLAALAAGLSPIRAYGDDRFKNLVPQGRKVRLACIGGGGKGVSDIAACSDAGADIVAICDVDFRECLESFGRFPQAARYSDYRQMLNEMGDSIDAVTVTVPDHSHFPAALSAVEMGKHVYVQKPLCHTIAEVRALKAAVEKAGVVSQMGNQGHCNEGTRLTKEWIEDGAIGDVREVHSWTNRPIWPQGMNPASGDPLLRPTLDWNLWLGVAPDSATRSCLSTGAAIGIMAAEPWETWAAT
jgi:predicted dehydrogenase